VIDNLFNLSSAEAGQIELLEEIVHIDDIIEASREMVAGIALAKGLRLDVRYAETRACCARSCCNCC
jgi:signal transduction histidine kinase